MTRKTLLIIFTYKYPFEPPTEQFLDDEIYFLNRKDVDILLVPNARSKAETVYPFVQGKGNICICKLKREPIQKEMISGTGIALKTIRQLSADIHSVNRKVKSEFRKPVCRLTAEQYIQGGAMFHELITQIPEKYFAGRERVILYSYWLNSMVIAEALYKRYLKRITSAEVFAYARAHGDGDLYVMGMDHYRPGTELINKEIDEVFPISENGRKTLMDQGIKRCTTCRLGVKKRVRFLEEAEHIPLIVSCSVINDNKRVDKIAEIISLLQTKVRWIHFGGGPNEEAVRALCGRIMPANVEWKINGWTDHDEVMSFYQEQRPDLFINASRVEGIPVSIMEAMSFSIPCVATDVGASDEVVNDGNGFLVEPEFSVSEAAKKIEEFLNSSKDRNNQMRKAAYEMFEKGYDSETNYSAFSEILLLGRKDLC